MKRTFDIIRQPRQFLLSITDYLTIAQLNEIPAGFNNNIIWNLGHVVAAQQKICYHRVDLPMHISNDFFDFYKPDSKPESWVTQDGLEKIKQLYTTTIDQMETDYANGVFNHYIPWMSRYGVPINNIEDALNFLPFHEGLHVGYVMALKRVLK